MYRYVIGSLVALAIVFGIWLVHKPALPIQGTTWRVIPNVAKQKATDEYDVIIVGGGFGGLSAGALLAKNDYKVLLVEKNSEVGGVCSGYNKNGFSFSYGAEDIEGLWDRGSIRYLLDQVAFPQSNFFVPNTRRIIVGDSFIEVGTSPNAMEEALVQKFPMEEKAIHEFFAKAKKVYLEIYDPEMIREWGVVLPSELAPEVMSKIWNDTYAGTHTNLLDWNEKTYQEVLDEYFSDIALKRILCGLLGYFGTVPAKTPASKVVYSSFGYFLYGGYHALHTPEHLAQALAGYIRQHKGTILENAYANEILIGPKGVEGIRVGEKKYEAPIVISNVNAKITYTDLINKKFIDQAFRSHVVELPVGPSCFALHLAVPSPLSQYPALIQDKDNQTYITISSQDDPYLAPEGQSAVILRATARFSDFFALSKEQENELIRTRTEALLARGKALVPELTNATVLKVLTPATYEQLANLPQGAHSWMDMSLKERKLNFKGVIPGLYLSSASVEGPGVASVIRNGILCAQDIMGWEVDWSVGER